MQYKLLGLEGWERVKQKQDVLQLLQLLQNITFKQDGSKHSILELVETERNIMLCLRRTTISGINYTREFKARVEAR